MLEFSISLRIILQGLAMKHEPSPLLEDNPSFQQTGLYSPAATLQGDCLYVGLLSEILPIADQHPNISFLCLRDRFADESEHLDKMQNIVVMVCNIRLYDLYNKICDVFRRLQNWNMEMALSVASNQGIQHLLDLSEPIIGNHIDVLDATFKLLAYTRNIPSDDEITRNLVAKGYHCDDTVNALRKLRRFEEYEKIHSIIVSDDYKLCKYVTVKRVFHLQNKPALYIIMPCNNKKADKSLLDLFQMLLNYIERYTERDYLFPATFVAPKQYLWDLLDGNISTVDEAVSRASYATIPFQQTYQLYEIAFDDNFNTPLDNLAININKSLPFSYVLPYHRRIVILHSPKPHANNIEKVSQILKKCLATFPCMVGISNCFQNLWESRSALEQAGCAIEYGAHIRRSLDQKKRKNILFYSFEECFLTLIVAKSFNTSSDIFQNCFMIRAIQTLKAYDEEHNSTMLNTLKVYLDSSQKATITSEQLHMHRNTVLYHIDRIESLLEVSLSDPDVALKLQLGLAVFQSNMIEMLIQ